MVKKMHSLYRMVYRVLRGRILSGQYEPGDRIETEPELAKQFKTSLITIRQAQKMLVEEGLLDKQQGRGSFVPLSVRRRRKILCVCGLHMTDGIRGKIGTYHADLILLSQQEALKRNMEFDTAWIPQFEAKMAQRYCEESAVREYWGFIFVSCASTHPLLEYVRKMKMRHVVISQSPHEDRWISLDFQQACKLALAEFRDEPQTRPLILGIENMSGAVNNALKATGQAAETVWLADVASGLSFETAGYLRTLELIRSGHDLSRVIFLDDIVAQGGTRAMLEGGYGPRKPRIVVVGGQQEMIPLGFPVKFVVHDTAAEVQQAFRILDLSPAEKDPQVTCWCSPYRAASADEVLAEVPPPIL